MTPADLIAFENDIANDFNAGKIKAPVHLAGGNEQQLIDIFAGITQKTHSRTNLQTRQIGG